MAFFLLQVLSGVVMGIAAGLSQKRNPGQPGPDMATMVMLVLFLMAVLSVLLVFAFTRFIDKRPFKTLGFGWKEYRDDAWIGLLLAPAILGIGTLVLFFTGHLRWNDAIFDGAEFFMSIVLMMMIAAGEELVFRGYLLHNLMESMNKWAAFGITTLLFTVAHIANPSITPVAIINVMLGGALLSINYIYTRNLWFCFLFHFSWNFLQGPVLGYEVSGVELQSILQVELSGNPLVTGGQFGFEGSIVNTLLSLISLLLLYVLYEKKYPK
jgi:membrane protease YdiL (CAAX protease family)